MKEPLKKESPPSRLLPHVQRRHGATVHDDSGHLWAVSYSDFLMVLLCFFIIFFSTDPEKKENIIQKIFLNSSKESGATPMSTEKSRALAGNMDYPKDEIEADLQQFSLSKDQSTEGLVVQFQDDFYGKGSYDISGPRLDMLNHFLSKVMPYRSQISLTFIGHTDDTQVVASKRKAFLDNFDLSAIRATRALQFAVRAGFPEDQVSAKGNSKNSRASRSLSVLIRPRGDSL